MKLYIVKAEACFGSSRLEKILDEIACKNESRCQTEIIYGSDEFCTAADAGLLRNAKIIFAIEIPKSGINPDAYRILAFLQESISEPDNAALSSERNTLRSERNTLQLEENFLWSEEKTSGWDKNISVPEENTLGSGKNDSGKNVSSSDKNVSGVEENKGLLEGSTGGVIIDGQTDLYTKDMGRRIIFAANMAGCSFPGKPLVEATSTLMNFKVLAKLWDTDLEGAYFKSCLLLAEKVLSFSEERKERQDSRREGKLNILVIHASSHKTSNSLSLWKKVSSHLKEQAEIEEVSIRNGQVSDCRGCKYEDCLHFGEKGACFYGGVMVEKIYPAIIKCDILVLICPNYNDSVSANIMAFINRLTSVFRVNDFSQKKIYAVIVSGYSGGDIVAQQVIGAINVNKNFMLPGRFAIIETANAPGDIDKIEGVDGRAKSFAERIAGTEYIQD